MYFQTLKNQNLNNQLNFLIILDKNISDEIICFFNLLDLIKFSFIN